MQFNPIQILVEKKALKEKLYKFIFRSKPELSYYYYVGRIEWCMEKRWTLKFFPATDHFEKDGTTRNMEILHISFHFQHQQSYTMQLNLTLPLKSTCCKKSTIGLRLLTVKIRWLYGKAIDC
uniref:CSON004067 protein n=1 Tax=Culicoides sonorensis TaxID=179676 RepID=A0A336LT14_CULSO